MNFHGIQKTSLVDYPGFICTTIFTKGCNMRCGYCHNADLVLPQRKVPSIPEREILNVLEKRKKDIEGVCITGGEPTLHKTLPEFIQKVKDMGLKVKLDTNGTNPDMVQILINKHLVDYIAMDIKAPRQTYHLVSRLPIKLVEKVFQTITILENSSIEYEFRTTISRYMHTAEDLCAICKHINFAPKYILQRSNNHFAMEEQVRKTTDFTDTEMNEFIQTLKPQFSGELSWR